MDTLTEEDRLFVTGQNAYWDGYAIYCMDGIYSPAQLEIFRKGYVSARKEDKGR